jgi:large subunit ribosomal protein L13
VTGQDWVGRALIQKTYTPKMAEIEPTWWLIDAEGQTLGRLATRIALVLRGKHRPQYTPHLDMGDYVVVVNAAKIGVTGNKLDQKMYYRHSGYPGGLREMTLAQLMRRRPERVIRLAVRGMLPRHRLGRALLKKLKIYAGPEHPHAAQGPSPLDLMASSPLLSRAYLASGESTPKGKVTDVGQGSAPEETLTPAVATTEKDHAAATQESAAPEATTVDDHDAATEGDAAPESEE